MSTNFYAVEFTGSCPTCGHEASSSRRHIGKRSSGWTFALHIYPDEGINSIEDWKLIFDDKSIVDEYGNMFSAAEMVDIIEQGVGNVPTPLQSRLIDGYYCVGRDGGGCVLAWDHCVGNFC